MKRILSVFVILVLMFTMITACSETNGNQSEVSQESTDDVQVSSTVEEEDSTVPLETSDVSELETSDVSEPVDLKTSGASESTVPAVLDIDAEDATSYNTKENAVPLGKWVYYQEKNYTSGEYEPLYFRIVRVIRDEAEIQAEIDAYTGIMDFSLTENQARDIEYGILEYEIYFAPDYEAPDYGITAPSVSLRAQALETTGFKTDGGMSYIGIGSSYSLNSGDSNNLPKPGDIMSQKRLFTILKNYDESEYVLATTWYDGEIVTEKARDLYFAIVE